MTRTKAAPAKTEKQPADRKLLQRIWQAQATRLAEILENTPASEIPAATLNVARQFLADNSIDEESLNRESETKKRLRRTVGDLPFPKAATDGAPTAEAARAPDMQYPFAPQSSEEGEDR